MQAAALEAKRHAEQQLQDAAMQKQQLEVEKQGPVGEVEQAARRLADLRGEVHEGEATREVLLHDAKQLQAPAEHAIQQASEYVDVGVV